MAEVAFRYTAGESFLHRSDPRAKLIGLITLSIICAGRGLPGLGVLLISIFLILCTSSIPVKKALTELRGFLLFFLLIILISGIKTVPQNETSRLAISPVGLVTGIQTIARMGTVILAAVLFTASTTQREMRDAVWWFFKPVPFIPEIRLANMFSLSISFLPLLFSRTGDLRRAQLSRAIKNRPNPFRQIRLIAIPLLIGSFRRVDGIARAMESRCYQEETLLVKLSFKRTDLFFAFQTAFVCLAAVLVDRIVPL